MSLLLAPEISDRAHRNAAVDRLKKVGGFLPTWSELADPGERRKWQGARPCAHRSGCAGCRQSVAGALVQRFRPQDAARNTDARGVAAGIDRRQSADRRYGRLQFPDDRRAQGARRLRLPGAAPDHRRLRSVAPARDLAVDRELLPWRRCDLAHSWLPRRRRAPRRNEPRALRLAAKLGCRSGRHHPHARHREQRQGNLRQVRGTRS